MSGWTDERWSGNRYFKSCHKCVAPKRHDGCHATCEDYDREKAEYEEVRKSQKKEKDLCACILASNNRIKRHQGN